MNKVNNKEMNIPTFTVEDLINVEAHIGHRVGARLPRMRPYIYGESNGIHLIDVRRTAYSLKKSLEVLYTAASQGKRILFVSTSHKWDDLIKEVATDCGQYYVTKWRGGMMTNWRTIVSAIKELKRINRLLEKIEKDPSSSTLKKKEVGKIKVQQQKLDKCFGGIINMSGMPDMIVVMSAKEEDLAIREARCVGLPVLGICDTNSNPAVVDHVIPANDDSLKALTFFGNLFKTSILNGLKEWLGSGNAKKSEEKKSEGKSSAKKPAAKKTESKKTESKKTESKKSEEKKSEGKKSEEKKSEGKPSAKKPAAKKAAEVSKEESK